MSKLNKGKADGKTGIVPELLVYGEAELHDRLLQMITDVGRRGSGQRLERCRDCNLINHCDNRWGTSLLDVVGEVFEG